MTGFGGNQFPTIVLYPNIFCDRLDLKPATCICRGDGGAVTITFRTNKHLAVNDGDLRLRTATVVFERIPLTPQTGPPAVRHVMRIATPRTSSGGLTAGERVDAQRALDGLQDSNISLQLATITTKWAQNAPATCRVGLVSRNPSRFKVYVFWVPWLAAEPYIWLNMNLADDPHASTFTLGATQPVLPGGRLTRNKRLERASGRTSCIADEDVNPSIACECLIHEARDVFWFGDIGHHAQRRAAVLGRHCLALDVVGRQLDGRGVARTHHNLRAVAGQRGGAGASQALAGRCDDSDLALQAKIHGGPFRERGRQPSADWRCLAPRLPNAGLWHRRRIMFDCAPVGVATSSAASD